MKGNIDKYGDKNQLMVMMLILSAASCFVYLLICNSFRIDPKKQAAENKDRLQKIALAVVIFMCAVQLWIVHTTLNGEPFFNAKFLFISMGLLFAIIGNYMNNLKPNWFAGLRLPWTLENEDNWRRTHQLASKLWFAGGLLMALCGFVLPFKAAFASLIVIGLILVIVPGVFSYRIYKNETSTHV